MGSTVIKIVLVCIVGLNVVAFAFYGIDKQKAIKNRWRIPEKTLHLVGIFGGIGALTGMKHFRHKTKHKSFVVFVPIYAIINVIVIVYLLHLMLM